MADPRWDTIVRPNLPELIELIEPESLIIELYAEKLLSKDEWQKLRLSSKIKREKTGDLLVDILPQKGPLAFDTLVQSLRKTEQEHIVTDFLEPLQNGQTTYTETPDMMRMKAMEKEIRKLTEIKDELLKFEEVMKREQLRVKRQCTMATMRMKAMKKDIRKLTKRNKELLKSQELMKTEQLRVKRQCTMHEKIISFALRIKCKKTGWPVPSWKTDTPCLVKSDLPNQYYKAATSGRVATVNGTITVGLEKTVYELRKENWQTSPVNISIYKLCECEGKCFILSRDKDKWKIFEYSEEEDTRAVTTLPEEHSLSSMSMIGNEGKIYVVGGKRNSIGTAQVHCYNLQTDKWIALQSLSGGRFDCSLSIFDGNLYVGGGWTAERKPCRSVERLSLEAEHPDEWTQLHPTTKRSCQLASLYGRLVATGGVNDAGHSSDVVEVFDEETDSWLPLPSMNTPRIHHGVCTTSDDCLVVVAGWGSYGSVESLDLDA